MPCGTLKPARITNIDWTVYGKIKSIAKTTTSETVSISYAYDAAGNRISKTVASSLTGTKNTYYVRDASGNVMSVYGTDAGVNNNHLTQNEVHLYGSSRLGIYKINRDVQNLALADYNNKINTLTRGYKFYELTNHLGNVLATVSDRKVMVLPENQGCSEGSALNKLDVYVRNGEAIYKARQEVNLLEGFESVPDDDFGVNTDESLTVCAEPDMTNPPAGSYYRADVVSAQDYYPFGMQMPDRGYSGASYRYGFNGKENDNEVKKDANGNDIIGAQQDYGMRIYDPRAGRFLSVDPLQKNYPELTPYQFTSNNPITNVDLDGKECYDYRLDLDDKGHKLSFSFIGLNTHGVAGWSIFSLLNVKVPNVDVYQQGKFIGRYSFNTLGQGGFETLKQFAGNENFRNDYIANNTTIEQSYREIAEEVGNTFKEGIQGAAISRYAIEGSQTKAQSKLEQKQVTQNTNSQASAANGGNPAAGEANTATTKPSTSPTLQQKKTTSIASEAIVRSKLNSQLNPNEILMEKPRFYINNGKNYATPDFAIYNTKTNHFVSIPDAKNGGGGLTPNQNILNTQGGEFRGSSRYPQAKPQSIAPGMVKEEKTALPYN